MRIFVSCIILLITLLQNVYSIDTNVVKYLPMKIGNIWIYHVTTTTPFYTNQYWKRIIDSTINYNGHIYYRLRGECRYVSGYPPCPGIAYDYLRIDSTTGVVYQYIQGINWCPGFPNLIKIDSLQAKLHDTVINCTQGGPYFWVCTDTSIQNIFGNSYQVKYFVCDYFEHYYSGKYAKNIGKYDYYSAGISGTSHDYLIGCVINGIVYGDTTFITGVNIISSEIPANISLSQNYPNPFNPITKIKFDIPLSRGVSAGRGVLVKLVIYDILGREIAALVNEQLQPGTYEVEWDASNSPSGVYFYKLVVSNEYSASRKMVLLK